MLTPLKFQGPLPRVWQTVEAKKMKMNSGTPSKKGDDTPVARVGWKKGKGTAATQFLLAMSDMQERMQERQMKHDAKMQEDAMKFQLKMDADRVKLEADISARLQQQSIPNCD